MEIKDSQLNYLNFNYAVVAVDGSDSKVYHLCENDQKAQENYEQIKEENIEEKKENEIVENNIEINESQ